MMLSTPRALPPFHETRLPYASVPVPVPVPLPLARVTREAPRPGLPPLPPSTNPLGATTTTTQWLIVMQAVAIVGAIVGGYKARTFRLKLDRVNHQVT